MPWRFSSSGFLERVKAQLFTNPQIHKSTELTPHPLTCPHHPLPSLHLPPRSHLLLPQILNKARVAAGVGIRDKDRGSRFSCFFILFFRSSRFLRSSDPEPDRNNDEPFFTPCLSKRTEFFPTLDVPVSYFPYLDFVMHKTSHLRVILFRSTSLNQI